MLPFKAKKSIIILFLVCLHFHSCNNDSSPKNTGSGGLNKEDTTEINFLIKRIHDRDIKNPDSLDFYLLSAAKLAEGTNYEKGLAEILFLQGNREYRENKYRGALKKYSKAKALADANNLLLLKAKCLERMASVHLETDDPHYALKLYYESLPIFEKLKYKIGMARVYNIIGVYKTETGKYDTAEIIYNKAINLVEGTDAKPELINLKGNLAYLYEKTDRLNEAIDLYQQLEKDLISLKDSINLAVIYFNHAELLQNSGRVSQGKPYLEKAIRISEMVKDTSLLADLYDNKGVQFLSISLYDSAGYFLEKSLLCASGIDNASTAEKALTWLVKIDSIKGDYKRAFLKSRRIGILKDTMYNRKLRNSLISSELKYENEKSSNLVKIQQLELHAMEKYKLVYLILLVVAILFAVLAVIVIILQRKNYLKSKELIVNRLEIKKLEVAKFQKDEEINRLKIKNITNELKMKDRELVSIALGIEQKNELLNRINEKVRKLMAGISSPENIAIINEITSSIRLKQFEGSESEMFNQRFTAIHEDFFKKLKELHPALTKTDLRFCAYLRINLSSDQIANIQNVTNEAIRKTRYRVRKKIGLRPDESLEDYILKF